MEKMDIVGGAAAGNITAVPGYFKAIRKVCDKYGVLLILDEVMSGCGRTGKFHAWEWEGVVPDIETCGKGLNGGYQALSAVLLSETIYLGLKSGSGAFANGQTYQNHPAACAAALTVMQIFEEDQVVKNCAERGDQVSLVLLVLELMSLYLDIVINDVLSAFYSLNSSTWGPSSCRRN